VARSSARLHAQRQLLLRKRARVQGDCAQADPLTEVTLDPGTATVSQCVLRVAAPVFEVVAGGELLLADVYLRLERTPAQQANVVALMTILQGSSWIVDTVFRGDSVSARGIDLGHGQQVQVASAPLSPRMGL
jgi:hypothetical protein